MGYEILNPRLNSMNMAPASGEIVVLNSDLAAEQMEFSGRLSNLYGVDTILISEDGGSSWKELPKTQNIRYAFTPIPGKRYHPLIRLKTSDIRDVILEFFPNVLSITYRDYNYEQLIVETVKKIADSYEARNVSMFSDLISRDFLGNTTFLIEGVRFDFDMFVDIRLVIFINRIVKTGSGYSVETKWDKTQIPRTTGLQQRTSGNTTMVFVLEDGKMKVQNLKGDLLYATLSPEIAESSGLNQQVIEEIRQAQNERIPVQPGAGETEQSGGTGSPINIFTSTMHTQPGGGSEGYDLRTGAEGAPGSLDVDYQGNTFLLTGSCKMRDMTGQTTFEDLTLAPTDGYTSPPGTLNVAAGSVFVFITNSGYYGKIKITSLTIVGMQFTAGYQSAVQTDGSRNITTN
jgi:hypothetical protein